MGLNDKLSQCTVYLIVLLHLHLNPIDRACKGACLCCTLCITVSNIHPASARTLTS